METIKIGSSFRKVDELKEESPSVKTPFELELETLYSQKLEIERNTQISIDERVKLMSGVDAVIEKRKQEHRKELFNASIKHNRPLFEAVVKLHNKQGIEPAWSDRIGDIISMHTEIMAKAEASKGCISDLKIRVTEIKKFREEIHAKFDAVEKARLEAIDFRAKAIEKIKLIEKEMLECASDAFEQEPRFVTMTMPPIAARLMGEAPEEQVKSPTTTSVPYGQNNAQTGAVGAVNFQTVAGIQIATRRAMKSEDNPHHKAMIDALTLDNVKKAVESGAKSNSNIECLAWIGKNIVGLNEVVIDQGLNSKVSLIRQALNYPKG